jgi:hypothetical protein
VCSALKISACPRPSQIPFRFELDGGGGGGGGGLLAASVSCVFESKDESTVKISAAHQDMQEEVKTHHDIISLILA